MKLPSRFHCLYICVCLCVCVSEAFSHGTLIHIYLCRYMLYIDHLSTYIYVGIQCNLLMAVVKSGTLQFNK